MANHSWMRIFSLHIFLCKDLKLFACILAVRQKARKDRFEEYRALKKHGCCRGGFFAGTLEHMSCYRYSQRKMREGAIHGFCWTLIIVLLFWTWHMIQHLIPVPNVLLKIRDLHHVTALQVSDLAYFWHLKKMTSEFCFTQPCCLTGELCQHHSYMLFNPYCYSFRWDNLTFRKPIYSWMCKKWQPEMVCSCQGNKARLQKRSNVCRFLFFQGWL